LRQHGTALAATEENPATNPTGPPVAKIATWFL
jgi:hypothetical protein